MQFDVYDLAWPAYSYLPLFFEYRFSVEAVRELELGLETGGTRAMAERRWIAQEGLCNQGIRGAVVGVREEV